MTLSHELGHLLLEHRFSNSLVDEMALPGLELHELQGARKGTWAVKVSGSWRVTFSFAGKDAERVDYEDYH